MTDLQASGAASLGVVVVVGRDPAPISKEEDVARSQVRDGEFSIGRDDHGGVGFDVNPLCCSCEPADSGDGEVGVRGLNSAQGIFRSKGCVHTVENETGGGSSSDRGIRAHRAVEGVGNDAQEGRVVGSLQVRRHHKGEPLRGQGSRDKGCQVKGRHGSESVVDLR